MSRVEGSCCFGVSSELSENKQEREAVERDEDETGKMEEDKTRREETHHKEERTKGSKADGGWDVRNKETG